jgi:hypothetical protein
MPLKLIGLADSVAARGPRLAKMDLKLKELSANGGNPVKAYTIDIKRFI